MSELPQGWELVQLGSVGTWGSGGTPKRTNEGYYAAKGIPWLVIGDLTDGLVVKSANSLTELGLQNSSAKLLPIGTLLVAMYGSIGKLGITGIECATNQAIAFCRPNEAVVSLRYLYHALFDAKPRLLALGQGGAQQNISQSVLKEFQIALAPKNEQTRIANQLDTLLARVQACNDRFDTIPALLKRFRQDVLHAATSGELTFDWRQSADSRDAQKPDTNWKGSNKLPFGWKQLPMRELVDCFDNMRIPIKASDRAIRKGTFDYYGAFGIIDSIDNFLFDGEYLLLAEDGKNLESRDRPIALIASGKFWVNNHAHVIRPNSALDIRFLLHWLNSKSCDISDLLTGIDQIKLTRGAMDRIPVPLPPANEQTEIVRRVEALFTLADRIEARCTAARVHAQRLTSLVLAKAFRGELVPQDPNDEPAAELLARIGLATAAAADADEKKLVARKQAARKQVTA